MSTQHHYPEFSDMHMEMLREKLAEHTNNETLTLQSLVWYDDCRGNYNVIADYEDGKDWTKLHRRTFEFRCWPMESGNLEDFEVL